MKFNIKYSIKDNHLFINDEEEVYLNIDNNILCQTSKGLAYKLATKMDEIGVCLFELIDIQDITFNDPYRFILYIIKNKHIKGHIKMSFNKKFNEVPEKPHKKGKYGTNRTQITLEDGRKVTVNGITMKDKSEDLF